MCSNYSLRSQQRKLRLTKEHILLLSYPTGSRNKKLAAVESAVKLTDGTRKSSDGSWGCAVLSMLVMETTIVAAMLK